MWKTIDSAPKDGTWIDAWVIHPDRSKGGYRQTNIRWINDAWRSYDGAPVEGFFFPSQEVPTIRCSHWMPLPEPPQ